MPSVTLTLAQKDYLWEYLTHAPAALALLRAIECRELNDLATERPLFEHPMLDLGCGDGLFGQVFFAQHPELGLDYSRHELRTAASRGAYRALVQGDITAIPCPDNAFASVFSNGVLEHVHDLSQGLREIARVLRPGGRLIMTVPTMADELELSAAALLRSLGLRQWAQRYADFYNRAFGQINVHPVETWRELLAAGGLRLTYHRAYGSAAVFRLHDLTLPLSAPNFICKRLTGRWVALPMLRRATLAPIWATWLRGLYLDRESPGCSLLMIAESNKIV